MLPGPVNRHFGASAGLSGANRRDTPCAPRATFATVCGVTRIHRELISVRYAETDRMGVAHHSSYLLWFEIGRTGLLREAGHGYRGLEADGVMLPVVEYGCRFLKSAD